MKGLTVGVGRIWIGAEVVIEGDVLLEDHDHVLDRGRGAAGMAQLSVTADVGPKRLMTAVKTAGIGGLGDEHCRRSAYQRRCHQCHLAFAQHLVPLLSVADRSAPGISARRSPLSCSASRLELPTRDRLVIEL